VWKGRRETKRGTRLGGGGRAEEGTEETSGGKKRNGHAESLRGKDQGDKAFLSLTGESPVSEKIA